MTTLPLSIAKPNGALCSGDKAKLRNKLIEEFFTTEPPDKAAYMISSGRHNIWSSGLLKEEENCNHKEPTLRFHYLILNLHLTLLLLQKIVMCLFC